MAVFQAPYIGGVLVLWGDRLLHPSNCVVNVKAQRLKPRQFWSPSVAKFSASRLRW
jgi:hypothetical protein